MKKVLIFFIVLASCSSPGNNTELDPEMFKSRIDDGAALIDVRTPEEYASGHIPGSRNIDIKDAAFNENILALDKTSQYAVYCASGVRSGKAADMMRQNGFNNVSTLAGGLKTWKEKGLPLE